MDGPFRPRSQSSGVRVVAKFMDLRSEAQSSEDDPARMSVSFCTDGHAFVSTCVQAKHTRSTERSVYQLDNCYEEDKGVTEIYEVEVQPLVQRLFYGTNGCCLISYGAHQSWPAQLFQGSEENPSLAEKIVLEILHRNGKGIEVSDYEIFQDLIYDLLEPKEKCVQLKDLSKVKVDTVDEFKRYYYQNDRLVRGPRGIILYTSHSSKFMFLDLGGYGGTTENKSLHAVMKIVYSLNSKNFISYRDSKFTHQLNDFLSLKSGSVVIACLSRTSNQQNRRALMLAASSSQAANQIQSSAIRRPTKKYVAPLERRYSMAVTQMKPIYEKVDRRASARYSIKKPSSIKERVQSCAAKSMAKLTLDEDLFNETQVEKSISEEDTHGELADIQEYAMPGATYGGLADLQEYAMPGVQQEFDNEESAESGITDALNLDIQHDVALNLTIQHEEISSANEEHKCGDTIEETSSNHTTSENSTAEEEHKTPARLTEPFSKVTNLLREISNSVKSIPNKGESIHIFTPKRVSFSSCTGFRDSALKIADMSQGSLMACTTDMKKSLQRGCLTYINSANKTDLKRLKGIGEVRANRILQLRDNNPEPFKDVEDLKNIGITPKQFDKMVFSFLEDC